LAHEEVENRQSRHNKHFITMLKNYLILLLAIGSTAHVYGQSILTPSKSFSHKKTSYVTLTDGTEIKGNIEDIDRKDGLIKLVKIRDGSGIKHKFKAEMIEEMYLMPSGFDKMVKAINVIHDASKWNDEKIDQDLVNQGYVYFVNASVKLKKKARPLLMQLLNPDFSKKVKIYDDPFAKQSISANVGGVKVAGGNAKSYFIQVGDDQAAYKVEKKRYKKEFLPLWNKCDAIISKYPEINWSDLTQHTLDYTSCE
jgi:hypothetical protein